VESLLPHLQQLNEGKIIFEQDFGLCTLPEQPGFLSIRGPRQFGKSTWLEQKLFQTLFAFGLGSSFYQNMRNTAF
jgi:predicted AAA+ superfamily ATPase